MNETEHHCSICNRYLTEEELVINKQHKNSIAEAKCYYCYVEALHLLMKVSEQKYPIPKAEDFGRDEEDASKITGPAEDTRTTDTDQPWPIETVDKFQKEHGLDLNEHIETTHHKAKPLPQLNKEALTSRKLTQISARGVSEDVSLTFTVPRGLLDPRLEQGIQNGLNNVLLSLMSVLAFAPLHNGVMQSILQPPPANPFGFPTQGGPNLFGD